jgi:hypothetical protein
VERKNSTILENQAAWIEEANVNRSRLVQESIDERMANGG